MNTRARAASFGRDIHDDLAVSHQPRHDVSPAPVRSLDGPTARRPLLGVLHHFQETDRIGGEPPATEDRLVACHHLDRR
jgi:hypothetical protein